MQPLVINIRIEDAVHILGLADMEFVQWQRNRAKPWGRTLDHVICSREVHLLSKRRLIAESLADDPEEFQGNLLELGIDPQELLTSYKQPDSLDWYELTGDTRGRTVFAVGFLPAEGGTLFIIRGMQSETDEYHAQVFANFLREGAKTLLIQQVEQPPTGQEAPEQEEAPPSPLQDGWEAVFDWYWRNRNNVRSLSDLATIIGYDAGTVRNQHSQYRAAHPSHKK